MNLKTTCIDYTKASVEEREAFSLVPSKIQELEQFILQTYQLDGCIILSTCNRTELWISAPEAVLSSLSPTAILCDALQVPVEQYLSFFIERSGKDAVSYLLELTCGLHSQIFGEDQILSQVKDALSTARINGTTNTVLEVLFRTAITAAKEVKTKVRLTTADHTVALGAVALLKDKLHVPMQQLPCLVIGNGEMGRLAVSALQKEGCKVTMTLRNHHSRESVIPANCRVLNYDERIEKINQFRVVISATLSPHQTIKKQDLVPVLDNQPHIFIDLAMPRDIDSRVTQLPNVLLFDMDDLSLPPSVVTIEQIQYAKEILLEHQTEFEHWYAFREWVPTIQSISKTVAQDVHIRTAKSLKDCHLKKEQSIAMQDTIDTAANKAVAKLLYGLREHLTQDYFQVCMEALVKSAEDTKS